MKKTFQGSNKAVIAWVAFGVFAFVNGAFGALVVEPLAGAYANHVYKSVTAIILIVFLARWTAQSLTSQRSAWKVGVLWATAAVLFEFIVVGTLSRAPLSEMAADYHIQDGRLWGLVVATLLFAPPLWRKLMHPRRR